MESISSTRIMDRNMSDVAFTLANHVISAKAKDANFVFSPLSSQVVLGLIASGSGGPTRETILGFLKSNSTEELNTTLVNLVFSVFADGEPLGGPRLSVANGIWFNKNIKLKPSFIEIVENVYKASSNYVDFQNKADEVREEVNKWIETATNGLIKNMLGSSSVNAMTRLIFANAVYFKADWQEQFVPEDTEDDKFFLLNGSSVQVPFMRRAGGREYIGVFDGFKVLRLPYEQGGDTNRRFSMYFFLPDDREGLPDLVEKVGSESGFIDRHIPHDTVRLGSLRIPKFKIEFGFEVSDVLKNLGVVLGGRGLTEMVDSREEDFSASRILHKAFIEVDEYGTEAAAVEVEEYVGFSLSDVEVKYVDFVADHPLMFVIREDVTGAVLFIGQLFDPIAAYVAPKLKPKMDEYFDVYEELDDDFELFDMDFKLFD